MRRRGEVEEKDAEIQKEFKPFIYEPDFEDKVAEVPPKDPKNKLKLDFS